jgi:hypothetical protein
MQITRVYHHYEKWEEYPGGLWKKILGPDRDASVEKAVAFTGDAQLYGKWMMKVLIAWPISCEHNLSCSSMNRQAWIGHAACCLAIGCPEDVTREAWHRLTDEQRSDANAMADAAISTWEFAQRERIMECPNGNSAQMFLPLPGKE